MRVPAARLLFVADTHLSKRAPEANANWSAVARYAAETRPDLVIHLGDVTLDGARAQDDIRHARAWLDLVDAPWRAVPGNHDVGDNPWPGAPDHTTIDGPRRQRWLDTIGADWWSVHLGSWTLLAINAQLLGTNSGAELEQWNWLRGRCEAIGDRHVAFVTHKPLTADDDELSTAPAYRFIPPHARARLETVLDPLDAPIVFSGHVHQARDLTIGIRRHVWAPTTWATLPEDVQPTLGQKRCGALSVSLRDDGNVDVAVVEPPGMEQFMLGRDIADPYVH